MTTIVEPHFTLELPGEWCETASGEPGVFAYRSAGSREVLTVTLLQVKPIFTIAEPARLLDDYLHHRPKFEANRDPTMTQAQPWRTEGDAPEGGWQSGDPETGHWVRHRVVLTGNMLADVVFEAWGVDEDAFAGKAVPVLEAISIRV